MAYRSAIGTFQGAPPSLPGFPGSLPSFVPGPGAPNVPAIPSPAMAAGIFPTTLRVGDVAQVTGPFAGKMQGQVVVRFAGTRGIAINLTGPVGGSVIVPPGAETGACTITVDGRQVFGTNCVISKGPGAGPRRGSWYNFGPLSGRLASAEGLGAASMGGTVGVLAVVGLAYVLFVLAGDKT